MTLTLDIEVYYKDEIYIAKEKTRELCGTGVNEEEAIDSLLSHVAKYRIRVNKPE